MKAANENTKPKASIRKRVARGDVTYEFGRPIAWDADNDNELPTDPDRYVALDGVTERSA